jgi:CRISPR-associated protein Cas2
VAQFLMSRVVHFLVDIRRQLVRLRSEIMKLVHPDNDFVIIYNLPDGVKLNRDIITNTPDPTSNIL